MLSTLGTAFAALLAAASLSHAASLQVLPVSRIHHPRGVSLELSPRSPAGWTRTANMPAAPAGGPPPRARERRSPSSLLHDDSFRVFLEVDGEEYALHMTPNLHLIHPRAKIITPTSSTPLLASEVLAFEGFVVPFNASADRHLEDLALVDPATTFSLGWARLLVHDAAEGIFEGAFSINGDIHHILRTETYLRTKHADDPLPEEGQRLVVFRDRDHLRDAARSSSDGGEGCTHDHLEFNTGSQHPIFQDRFARVRPWWTLDGTVDGVKIGKQDPRWFGKRDDVSGGTVGGQGDFTSTIGQTQGCPNTQKVVFTGVAADCAYVNRKGGADEARRAILSNWNTASALYKETFNVSLGIVELFVQDTACPATASTDVPWNVGCDTMNLNDRLSAFSTWRGRRSGDQAGLWHLMSGCPTGSEVGVAWLGQLCVQSATSQGSQGTVSGTAVSTASNIEWQVVAHETGHNFGAIHDCRTGCTVQNGNCCSLSTTTCDAGGQYIMSPVSSNSESRFSPCTIGNICSVMQSRAVNTRCLADPGSVTLISTEQCGNGILEPGEDCDPGGAESACCDAATCKFVNNAVCDPTSSPCCTSTCNYATNGTVCRSSVGECDVVETCTGNSSSCPSDVTVPDGQSCGSGDGLQCASGVCTSRDLQCQTVGSSLNITGACQSSNSQCSMACQDPRNSGRCLILQATFQDGTPCGFAGRCKSGECHANSNGLETAKAWYRDNLKIAVPVTVVVGLIVLFLLYAISRCIFRSCSGSKRSNSHTPPPVAYGSGPAGMMRNSANSSNSAAPLSYQQQQQGYYSGVNAYGDTGEYQPQMTQQQPYHGGRGGGNDWIDPSQYNGPNNHSPYR